MLLSMTGFGEAHCQQDGLAVAVEVRSINNRYLKMTVRCGEGYGLLEPQVESVVRERIRRGTIQVNVRVERTKSPEDYTINQSVLDSYRQQLAQWCEKQGLNGPIPVEHLLLLPGVVDENGRHQVDAEAEWPLVRDTLLLAMDNLIRMRTEAGRAMEADLRANCLTVAQSLGEIEKRAPLVVDNYRKRLEDRLTKTLADFQMELDPADLIKEVSLFAERGDISEEIVRLRSHLEQFDTILGREENSSGRKLEFLTQEMFREINTIGSKASDVEIARHVIEIKASIERIREQIQNIE